VNLVTQAKWKYKTPDAMTVTAPGYWQVLPRGEAMAEPEKNFLQQLIDGVSGWKGSFEELRQRIGWLGAVMVLLIAAVIAASFYIWSNWKDIKERPGIEGVIKRFKRRAIDKVPAGVLTIAVAHLQDDEGQKQEKLLLDELKHFDGVETLTVDRTMEWPASGTEQAKKKKPKRKHAACSGKPAPMF
jgi:hypothetical protein